MTPTSHRAKFRRTKRDRKRLRRIRSRSFGIGLERLEDRAMLAGYAFWNLVNTSDYSLVFLEGTEQNGLSVYPDPGTVIAPSLNYDLARFQTYRIDVRADASNVSTSIGIASVEVLGNGDTVNFSLQDQAGLLNFTYSESYSRNLSSPPWYDSGQLITVNLPLWGWNNDTPYDLQFTSVTGTDSSPAVGTVIASGDRLDSIMGSGFEFDILAAGGTEILGHSVIAVGTDSNGNKYLYDTKNLAVFSYNSADSAASGYTNNWQDITIDLAPPVISNEGWTSGMGNTSATATPGQSFWAIDYGSEDGRWTIEDGAAWQSTEGIDWGGGSNYGSRAYPVALDANYQPSYGPGAGFDGLWQMDIKIGSTGTSDNAFVETFYLAERVDPREGPQYYSDGSPNGGGTAENPGPWSREIDIMETRWNGGGKVGPQINLPTGQGNGGPFTGWTTDHTYYDTVLGEWSEIGGAPTAEFATFGILIRGESAWIYAYKPDGTLWYSTEEIIENSDYQQSAPFVPYIGTWGGPELGTVTDIFKTGYKNFIYLPADNPLIATANPLDNPNAFGPALVSATASGDLAFSGVGTLADSLRLAEDELPQVPGLDVSLGQMLPVRLSDILGLDVEGNGQTTWSDFDSVYPTPSVADLQRVANAITSGTAWPAEVLPSTSGTSTSAGSALTSTAATPQFGKIDDLSTGLGEFTIQSWLKSTDISLDNQTIVDFGDAEDSGQGSMALRLRGGVVVLSLGGSDYASTTPLTSNTWTHVSLVVDGTTASLSINGTLSDTFADVASPANLAWLENYWGRSSNGTGPAWEGQLDELRVWSRSLTAGEIAANYRLVLEGGQAGLLAYFRSDESSGSALLDSSSQDNAAVRMTVDESGNLVTTTSILPSSLTGLLAQNGVVLTWTPAQTYQAVISTGSLDEVLKLRRGPAATIPVVASGTLQLTLALSAGGDLVTGISASWAAAANEQGLTIDAGLGYLDTKISGATYTLSANATAHLKSPDSTATFPGGTTATSSTVASLSATQATAALFPSSGTITVAANLPLSGDVGGVVLPTGAQAPTVSLPSSSHSWAASSSYVQPTWRLANMGSYLSLAQLDVAALVSTGLHSTGGSLAGIERTDWLTVPFSSEVVGYDWGAGLSDVANLMTEKLRVISAFQRVTGWVPENNYGATFNVLRDGAGTTVELLGNLQSDAPSVSGESPLIAAELAAHFTARLTDSGLACRETPGRPGFLEFYAADPAITGFTMTPLTPSSGDYLIGTRSANAFSALGFFAEQTAALQLANGSFEGPYAGTTATPYVVGPSGGQWVFTGTAGLARNGSEWFLPAAPDGQQAAFIEDQGSITETLYDLPEGTYQLSFSATQRSDVAATGLNVVVDGIVRMTVAADELLSLSWKEFVTPALTLSAGKHTIAFQGIGDSTGTAATAIDAVVLVTNLTAQVSSAPTFATLSGLLELLNQHNLVGAAAAPTLLAGNDAALGQVAIDAAHPFTAATLPTAIQFVANTPSGMVTPLIFEVSGTGTAATYTLAAAGRSIAVVRSGLQTWPLLLPAFTADQSANYVLGFTDRSMEVTDDAITTTASYAGTIGVDMTSGAGSWLGTTGALAVDPGDSLALGTVFGESSGLGLAAGRGYALASFSGLAQAGSGSVARPDTDAAVLGTYAFAGASYTASFVPTAVRFYATEAGSITPVLLEGGGDDRYTVAAVGDAITFPTPGLNEHPVFFPTLGSLTPGKTYLFGYQDAASGTVAVQNDSSGAGAWLSAATAATVSQGLTTSFVPAPLHSLDIIASTASGSPVTTETAAVFDTTVGQVMIDTATTFTNGILPTAIQIAAALPDGVGAAFVTPLLFSVTGTSAGPEYTLVGAAASQQITAAGVFQLPVAFTSALLADLSPAGSYAMGFSTVHVQIATGGAIRPTAAFTGIVGRASGTSGGRWLVSDGLGTNFARGNVFAVGATGSQIEVAAGSTYACTFLTQATQANQPASLVSIQYAGGLTIGLSYTDLTVTTGLLGIEAEAISALQVPGVSGLALVGAEDVSAAMAATRQFTLALDAGVMTTGATLANQQQQAAAIPVTTGVLTEITVSPGSQRFGIDGYLSAEISVSAGTQVYATPPTVIISDAGGTGSGATATASLDPNTGRLQSITLVTAGKGYTQPVFSLSGSNAPATVAARWAAGVVTGGVVVDGGQFYAAPPAIAIIDEAGAGAGATATATLTNGVVTAITMTSGGSGYVRPRMVVSPPTVINGEAMALLPVPVATVVDATGLGATATVLTDASGIITGIAVGNYQATATVSASNGIVTAIDLTFGGQKYSAATPPTVVVTDASGSGQGAAATATVSEAGVVIGITLIDGGSGYVDPVLTIGPPSILNSGYTAPTIELSIPGRPDFTFLGTVSATVSKGVNQAAITSPGVLYQAIPGVTITDSSGFGSGAAAVAVMEGGRIVDIVFTSFGSNYTSPVITIDAPWVDISAAPQGPSQVNHVFYFLDGSTWSTTTSSESGISLQYQLIDQLTQLADAAAAGLIGGSGLTTADAYTLQAYLAPLLGEDSPTAALTENLSVVMPTASNAPLVWYMSARSNDSLVGQALFPSYAWTVATVGGVTLGDISLALNLRGTSADPGFTGSAQVGYVDVDLTANTFTPALAFSLQTAPNLFQSFGTWQSILTSDQLLAVNATTTAVIEAYDLTFAAAVSPQVEELVGSQFTGIPQLTLSAHSGADGGFAASLTDANWGGAQGLLFIDAADLAPTFESVAGVLAATDTAGLLAAPVPFVSRSLQEITGFSELFVGQIEEQLVEDLPDDLDALLTWASSTKIFTPVYGAAAAGGTTGYALTLVPATNWIEAVAGTTQVALDFGAMADLAAGQPEATEDQPGSLPESQSMLANTVIPPANTGDVTVSLNASWQAPFGALFVASGAGSTLAYESSGYVSGSDSTQAWVLSEITVLGSSLDFEGTLGTLPIVFDASASTPATSAEVSLSGGGLTTNLAAATLALDFSNAALTSSVTGGTYSAVLPVYYPTATCYAGRFTIGKADGSAASLAGFLTPGVGPTLALGLPSITNAAISALSLADAIGNPDVFQANLKNLSVAFSAAFSAAMKEQTQVVVGDGAKSFAAGYSTYNTIAAYVGETLPAFVPQCDQNATAAATTDSSGGITTITVLQSGTSYTAAPSVTILDLAGAGSGARATAVMGKDGNGGLKVVSIEIDAAGRGYAEPVVSIATPSAGQETADEQLFNEATTAYNIVLATPGLVLDGSMPFTVGTYLDRVTGNQQSGSLPAFFDDAGNLLTYSDQSRYFITSTGAQAIVDSVEFPLFIDYTLSATNIPFDLGMPGLPLTFSELSALDLVAGGQASIDLSFGIDLVDGFFVAPGEGSHFSGTLKAGPAENFANSITVGILSGTMAANPGDVLSMGFTTQLTDPDSNGQITLKEINSLPAKAFFQASLANPVVDLKLDLELKVSGGGVTGALPSFTNTLSVGWPAGANQPTLSYDNFAVDLGSFVSDYLAPIITRLGPITSGIDPFLSALDTPIPILSDVIGGDTSLLGLASRFGGAEVGFVKAVAALATMVEDITSAVNYINQHPGASFKIPLPGAVSFATDFRNASASHSKPTAASATLPNQKQSISAMNSYLGQYQGAASNAFTKAAGKILNANSSYGVSGGLGISFDVLSGSALIDMLTGQTTDLFTITFPKLAANFSLDVSYPIAPPLSMTFGGGVNASAQLAVGMSTAGLELWIEALESAVAAEADIPGVVTSDDSFSSLLSPKALESLALDVIEEGLYIDGSATRITAGGYLQLGAQLNGGAAKAGVDGSFNIDMTMSPNTGGDGRLTLGEMIQLAGDNFSTPLNLFNFDFNGSISAEAYLKLYLPFKWRTVWSHNFGSYTVFDVENHPAPPTESAADVGSLFLNMGPTANRRGAATAGVIDEHFEIRHISGVAGNETVSVQFYVEGVAQYVDAEGNPRPQIYTGVTNILGMAGDGDDVVDCTGVLSPVRIDGGLGDDSIVGGAGLNVLTGDRGNDSIIATGIDDILQGGDGNDSISIGSVIARVAGGTGHDLFTSKGAREIAMAFEDNFGSDQFDIEDFSGISLDFSRVTQPLSVALGEHNRISLGGRNLLEWSAAGLGRLVLGSGHDLVSFGSGYRPIELDLGAGRNRIDVQAFEPGALVTILGDLAGDDQFTIRETAAQAISVIAGKVTADNGGGFVFDLAGLRKLVIQDSDAAVSIDLGGSPLERLHVSARTAAVISELVGTDLRLIGSHGVLIDAAMTAAEGGGILLGTTAIDAAVTIGKAAQAAITAARGNVAITGARLVVGDHATTPFTILGGGLTNNAGTTTVPAGRGLVGSTLLGPGGNYAGMYLADRDLTGVDLSGADLSGADLSGTILVGANLTSANLTNAKLGGADLTGARLIDAVLTRLEGVPASLPPGWSFASAAIGFEGVFVAAGKVEFLPLGFANNTLVKSGDGTLVIPWALSHAGGTVIEAGTLYALDIDALGSGDLAVAAGARVVLDVDFGTAKVASLTIANGGMIDIGNAKLKVLGGAHESKVKSWVVAGWDGGSWAGASGVSSSTVDPATHGIGYHMNADGSAIVMVAPLGDLNLDSTVDSFDLVQLLSRGRYGTGHPAGWGDGDVNYDGYVDIFDLTSIAAADRFASSPLPAPVAQAVLAVNGSGQADTGSTGSEITLSPAATDDRTELFRLYAAGLTYERPNQGEVGAKARRAGFVIG